LGPLRWAEGSLSWSASAERLARSVLLDVGVTAISPLISRALHELSSRAEHPLREVERMRSRGTLCFAWVFLSAAGAGVCDGCHRLVVRAEHKVPRLRSASPLSARDDSVSSGCQRARSEKQTQEPALSLSKGPSTALEMTVFLGREVVWGSAGRRVAFMPDAQVRNAWREVFCLMSAYSDISAHFESSPRIVIPSGASVARSGTDAESRDLVFCLRIF
jgi:hypothetical protein